MNASLMLCILLLFLLVNCSQQITEPSSELPPEPHATATIRATATIPTFDHTETDEWQLYSDEVFGIGFQYPENWQVSESIYPLDSYRGLDLTHETLGWIIISMEDNAEQLSPSAWLEIYGRNYRSDQSVEIGQLEIHNQPALLIGQPGTCRASPMITVLLGHGENMLIISHMETGKRDSAPELKHILETLTFNGYESISTALPESYFRFPSNENAVDCP